MSATETSAERIRALRLTKEEWFDAWLHSEDLPWKDAPRRAAEAQFTKLLRGLVEIMNDDPWVVNPVYEDYKELFRQALKEEDRGT